ncbi:hypothetical protein V5O48_012356 [Marasmius crinis-equi]|uniref:Glycoside hydrolase family 76 protein n=1 Tax=Marasmius crinis-equi TaxID=585013 RepID=A0ABR3F2Z7_9AGAR
MHGRVTLGALLTLLIYLCPVASLSFPSNPTWNSKVTQTSRNRLDTAYAALQEGVNLINSSLAGIAPDFSYPQLLAALANFEHTNKGNGTFYGLVSQYFQGQVPDPSGLKIRDILKWGYAAIRSYKAYGDNTFRDAAIKFWETAYHYTISNQTVALIAPLKNSSVPLHCTTSEGSPIDLQGATFLNTTDNDRRLSVYQSAYFALFSALLAESDPSNSTYLLASTESLNFALHFLQDSNMAALPFPNVVRFMPECPPFFLMFPQGTSTAGFVIEALATLGSMAKGDMVDILSETVAAVLETMSGGLSWFAADSGALPNAYRPFGGDSYDNTTSTDSVDQEDGDMYFLRGLAAALRLGEKLPANLRGVIKVIMGVHYNAIRNYAKFGEGLYGSSWSPGGSGSGSFDMYNQAAAAQILVDGIDLFEEDNNPSPGTLPSSKSRTGTIIGATIGSVIFVSILAIAIFMFLQRNHRRQAAPSSGFTSQRITPFRGEKPWQPFPHASRLHTKGRSGLPVSPDSRGTGVGSGSLVVPVPSAQGTPSSEPNEHRGDESVLDTRHEDGSEGITRQMEMAPGFPDMVRAVYQRLWERDGLETPPDYHSSVG